MGQCFLHQWGIIAFDIFMHAPRWFLLGRRCNRMRTWPFWMFWNFSCFPSLSFTRRRGGIIYLKHSGKNMYTLNMIKMLPISLLNSTQGGPITQSLPFISNSHVRPCVTQWAFLRKTILLGSMSFLSGTVLVMRPKASANKHVDGNSCWRKAWQWRSFSTLVTTCTYCKFVGSHCTGKQKTVQ